MVTSGFPEVCVKQFYPYITKYSEKLIKSHVSKFTLSCHYLKHGRPSNRDSIPTGFGGLSHLLQKHFVMDSARNKAFG